jgi:hypothetical protein
MQQTIGFPMKLNLIVLASIVLFISTLPAQLIETRGRITNSTYIYEGEKVDGTSGATTHTRLYQYLRLTARAKEWNNLSLNISARALSDLAEDLEDEDRFKAYRLSLSAERLFNILDFEVGRMFLHPGITFGSLDGANLRFWVNKQLSVQAFGGVESHLFRSFKIYDSEDATVYGGSVKYSRFFNTDLQLAYLQKQRSSSDQWQILGLNLSNYSLKTLSFLGQVHYDFINSRPHRIYFSARYLPSNKWNLVLNVKQQYPQIYGDSYFKIFDVKKYSQAGVSGGYSLTEKYAVNARYNYIKLEEGQGHRIILTLSDLNGSIGMIYETGDLGDQLGVILDYGYEFFPNFIGSLSIDYSRYRFEEVYDYESQLANAVRGVYKFAKHWRVDLEYQWLNNRFKDSDHRVLNHIHYIW